MGKNLKGKELGEGLSQRKDGRYQARFTNRFGKRVDHCDRELQIVKEWLEEEKAKDKLRMNVVDSDTTLDEWFIKWMEVYKYGVIAPNTERHYKQVYIKHISPVLGRNKLSAITHLQVKALINALDKAGYEYETKNKVRILILDMCDKAMLDDFIKKNPAKAIKLVRDEEKEPRFLTLEEQKLFFDYCKGTFYDNMFVVSVNTGLRPGEVYALTEKDLDFKKKTISVNKTLLYQKLEGDTQKTFHLGPPKTKASYRKVPMTRQCETALKKQILQSRIIKKKTPKVLQDEFKDLLFTTKYGTPINAQIECDAIKVILEGINFIRDELEQIETFSGHTFRHTFASNCYHNGFSLKAIQKLLGHATAQMTANLYVHLFGCDLEDNINDLSEAMEQLEQASDEEEIERRFQECITKEKNQRENLIQFAI